MLKIVEFLTRYKYMWISLGLVLLISYSSYSYYNYYNNQQNLKAADVIYQYRSQLVEAEKASGGTVLGSSELTAPQKAKDYNSIKKLVDSFVEFLKQESRPKTIHLAATVELSYFLIQYDQGEQALQLLDTVSSKNSKDNWLYYMSLIKLSSLFMEAKNYTRAIHLLSAVLEEEQAQSFHFEAWLKLALCYEALNEYAKAQEIYSSIQKKETASLYKEKAIHYDRLLKVKQKLVNKKSGS